METCHIRSCTQDDFAAVFELLKQLWPDGSLDFDALKGVYNKALASDFQRLIVARANGCIVGFCSLTLKNNLWQAGTLAHVDELVVDRGSRGLGIGKKLMEAITRLAEQAGCARIELDSAFHRREAHRFYESLGYENRAYLFSKILS